ncbi:uncharacterized protein LOC124144783 [Haliotis rufescens]|uniref:uncharacterized protein LOC124144783 n=1 Tax=Haliotis rufescens TaxID=6454 RepID=UPI001EAFCE0F|nr:uncharacterized protein LOC124144783 [Haliotis rufescens]XP_046370295.1 uncharacterized protein LOC124144783 [Haliotis rufescens]
MKFLVVLASLASLALSQHDHHKNTQAVAEHLFKLVDTDRSGDVSGSELLGVFHQYDTNGDNRLTEKEFYLGLCLHTPEICPETVGLFQELDTLNENVLWLENMHSVYSLFDTNGNGAITRSEFVTWMTNKLDAIKQTLPKH